MLCCTFVIHCHLFAQLLFIYVATRHAAPELHQIKQMQAMWVVTQIVSQQGHHTQVEHVSIWPPLPPLRLWAGPAPPSQNSTQWALMHKRIHTNTHKHTNTHAHNKRKYSHPLHPLKNQPNPISSLQYTVHLSEYLILFDTVRTADVHSYKEKTDTKV